jgi:hypothetical protein
VRIIRILLAALDLVTVAGALEGIATGSARGLVLILVAMLGAVLIFVAALFVVALLAQREPPYPV